MREIVAANSWILYAGIHESDSFWTIDPCGRTKLLVELFEWLGFDAEPVDVACAVIPTDLHRAAYRDNDANATQQLSEIMSSAKVWPALVVEDGVNWLFIEADIKLRYKNRRLLVSLRYEPFSFYFRALNRTVGLLVSPMTNRMRQAMGADPNYQRSRQTRAWHCAKMRRPAMEEIKANWQRLVDENKESWRPAAA